MMFELSCKETHETQRSGCCNAILWHLVVFAKFGLFWPHPFQKHHSKIWTTPWSKTLPDLGNVFIFLSLCLKSLHKWRTNNGTRKYVWISLDKLSCGWINWIIVAPTSSPFNKEYHWIPIAPHHSLHSAGETPPPELTLQVPQARTTFSARRGAPRTWKPWPAEYPPDGIFTTDCRNIQNI